MNDSVCTCVEGGHKVEEDRLWGSYFSSSSLVFVFDCS